MKEVIRGEHLFKKYKGGASEKPVLNDVSLVVYEGEFTAIMGASGSGKSTLLYVLSGMDGSDEGAVFFQEESLKGCSEEKLAALRREKMGFVFQQPTMLKNLNILDNILFPTFRSHGGGKNAVEKARALMERMGIGELAEREIGKVSGGQLQRAGICRALMGDPEILFADEPTGALNSKASVEIMGLIRDIHEKGTAVLLVTHDAQVAAYADRVLFFSDGKIVEELRFRPGDLRMEKIAESMNRIGV